MHQRRLVIAAEIFPPSVGGPATYAATLARELNRRGWQLAVVAYADTVPSGFPLTVHRVARRGSASQRYLRYYRTLWRVLRDYPCCFAQGPVSSGLPAYLAARRRRRRLVVKVTGDYAWEQAFRAGVTDVFIESFQRQPATGKYGWLRRIEQFVCRRADVVVTPSAFLQGLVSGWGVPAGRIRIIPNAIAPPDVPEERMQLRRQLGVGEDTFLIVTAGRPVPWKGYGELTRVVVRWLRVKPEVPLRLAVVGVSPTELAGFAQATGAEDFELHRDRITPLGVLPTAEVWRWLKAADVFALYSAYEGFSHVTVEAMQLGTPVVISRVGGNPELVQHGINGILVPYGHLEELTGALLDLYLHPARRAALGAAAQQSVRQFSVQQMVDQTAALLASVCG